MRSPRVALASVLLPVVCSLTFSSCATQMAINAAQGNPGGSAPNQPGYRTATPQPACYALVPLAIPFDIVTLPFQFIYANVTGTPFTGMPVASTPPPQQQQQDSQLLQSAPPPQQYQQQPPPQQ